MRLKDEESLADKDVRMTVVDKEIRSLAKQSLPILIGIILICITIVALTFILKGRNNEGNPYECENCRILSKACAEHRKFDFEYDLKIKIKKCVDIYDTYCNSNEEEYLKVYYNNVGYNNNCDFCNSNKCECSGCKYTRTSINQYIKEVYVDGFSISLCTECKEQGHAVCNYDKNELVTRTYDVITKQ